jgi:hypothetical protein
MIIQQVPISQIKPNPRNSRTHPGKQIRQIAKSIVAFGCTNPLLVDEDFVLIAGHGRYKAAELVGLTHRHSFRTSEARAPLIGRSSMLGNDGAETDCVAGHIGFELRCAERKIISLRYRVSSDLRGAAQTAAVSRENDLLW